MIDVGTNVIVVASSLSKGKTGPRIGSSGFTLGDDLAFTYKGCPLYPKYNKHLSTLFFPQKIIFTNFGFESKLRIEEKLVIGALPMPLPGKNFGKSLLHLINNLQHNCLRSKKWRETVNSEIYTVFNWKNKPICLIVPNTHPKQIETGSIVLFRAWLKAMLKSKQTSNYIFNVPLNRSGIDTKTINTLMSLFINSSKFNEVSDTFLMEHRKSIINTITWLKTVNIQHKTNTQIKNIKGLLINKKLEKKSNMEIISRIIFNPIFDKFYMTMKETSNKLETFHTVTMKNKILILMNNMLAVKAELAKLSTQIEKQIIR